MEICRYIKGPKERTPDGSREWASEEGSLPLDP
jgi:hypothetical protein